MNWRIMLQWKTFDYFPMDLNMNRGNSFAAMLWKKDSTPIVIVDTHEYEIVQNGSFARWKKGMTTERFVSVMK